MRSLRRAIALSSVLVLIPALSIAASAGVTVGPIADGTTHTLRPLAEDRFLLLMNGRDDMLATLNGEGGVLHATALDALVESLVGTRDGNVFLLGLKRPIGTTRVTRVLITKLEGDLKLVSSRTWEAAPGISYGFRAAAALPDGGALFAGVRLEEGDRRAVFARVSARGELEAITAVDTSGHEQFRAACASRDGGVVLGGESDGSPWLVKLTRQGKVAWQRRFEASGMVIALTERSNGEIVFGGSTFDQRGEWRAFAAAASGDGTVRWARRIPEFGEIRQLLETQTGNILLAGIADPLTLGIQELSPAGAALRGWSLHPGRETFRGIGSDSIMVRQGASILVAPPLSFPGLGNQSAVRLFALGKVNDCSWFEESSRDVTPLRLNPQSAIGVELESEILRESSGDFATENRSLVSTPFECEVRPHEPPKPAGRPSLSSFRGISEREEAVRRWGELFERKEYAELDRIADSLRATGTRSWSQLHPDLALLYGSFCCDLDEEDRIARYDEWLRRRPDSIAARIAAAQDLESIGWSKRGSAEGDTITAEGARQFMELSDRAWRHLEALGTRGEDDPVYWLLRILFAGAFGKGDVLELARRAARLGYDGTFTAAANYLLPQWGGSPEQVLAWADESVNLTRDRWGEALYSVIEEFVRSGVPEDIRKRDYPFDWKRVRKGLEDRIALNPAWLPTWHNLARRAQQYGDRAVARELFRRPELEWYDGAEMVWRSSDLYGAARTWALTEPAEPFMESASALPPAPASTLKPVSAPIAPKPAWQSLVLDGRLVTASGTFDLTAFLVETAEGVVAISAMPTSIPDDDAFGRLRLGMESWTMHAPQKAQPELRVGGFDREPVAYQRGLALALAPANGDLPAHPLRTLPAATMPALSSRVIVVACKRVETGCEPVRLEGEITGHDYTRQIAVAFEQAVKPEQLTGAPVVDENGNAIAVCNGMEFGSFTDHAVVVGADLVNYVLGKK